MRYCGCFLALLVLVAPAASQQTAPIYDLDGLIVTGVPEPRSESSIGGTVTVLEGRELSERGITRVVDALRTVPGVAVVESGSFGGVASLFLRGAESDYVQVLIDGVQVNQPGGAFDFSGLTTHNVERIEVLRGPASALYGSDAVGGVVHIITRSGSGSPTSTASITGGSYGGRLWSLDLRGGTESMSYGFGLSDSETDGILAFNNGFQNRELSGVVRFLPDTRSRIELATRLGGREFHYPTDGSGNVVDQNAFTFADEITLGLDAERQVSERVRVDLSLSSFASDGGTDDAIDSGADTLGFYGYTSLNSLERTRVRVQSHVLFSSSTSGTLGAELSDQKQRSFSESLSQYGPSSGESQNTRTNRAAFLHVASGFEAVDLNAGARIEDNELFGSTSTWQVGASWGYAEGGRFRASAGTGIKEPTFFENYATGFTIGNPDLAPERSSSWEVGWEQGLLNETVQFSGVWFDQDFQDLIQYTFSPPNAGDPNYFNVAEASARGLEAGMSISSGALTAGGDFTWLATEVIDSGFDSGEGATFVEGEALLRRPKSVVGASVSYRWNTGATLNSSIRRVGEREDRDFGSYPAAPVILESYTLLDASAEMPLLTTGNRSRLSLTLRASNLLDAEYEQISGFSAPGRQVYLGAKVGLGGGS